MNPQALTPAEQSYLAHLRGGAMGWWAKFWPVLETANADTLEKLAKAFPEEVAILRRVREDANYRTSLTA